LNNSLNKIAAYLGFAIKAGKVIWGVDNIIAKRERSLIILKDSSLAKGSSKKLANYALTKGIDIIEYQDLSLLTGRSAKAIGVTEPNLAAAINKIVKGE